MDKFPKDRIEKLIQEMHSYSSNGVGDRYQRPVMATIHGIIAEEQAKSAATLEKHTENLLRLAESIECSGSRLERLTRGLLYLTVVLVVFAAVDIVQVILRIIQHTAPATH
jgi:hypothetical protein